MDKGILENASAFEKNLEKYIEFTSWTQWYPDLFLDLTKPETGGIHLSSEQRLFLRSMARFYSVYGCFPRGFGKCVAGDTLLFTDEGLKEIGEIFNYQKDNIETWTEHFTNVLNRDGNIVTSNRGVYSGLKKTKLLTTEEGYSVEGTLIHPILRMSADGNIEFKQLQDIQIGDYIIISRNNNVWGNNTDINISQKMDDWISGLSNQSKSHLNIKRYPEVLTEDIALYFGYLVGDGCITKDSYVGFSNKDNHILDNFFRITTCVFGAQEPKYVSGVDYRIYDKHFRKYLEFMGLKCVNAFSKEVPKIIMSSPSNIVSKFLRGLYDTDGCAEKTKISYCTVSKRLAKQVQVLLLNYGIISKKLYRESNKGFFNYSVEIYGEDIEKFHTHVGFGVEYKQCALENLLNMERNTNKDIIPFQVDYINSFYQDIKKYNTYVYDNIYHILKGNNQLTYKKLNYLLSLDSAELCVGYEHLKNLQGYNYFFSRVKSIEDNESHVYDLEVPQTHSFVSNGIVSHNTHGEFLIMYLTAMRYPNINLSLTAQTKENASKLLKDKYNEIIKQYPMLENEVLKTPTFQRGDAEIPLKNGSTITSLANSQNSKGQRRHRLSVEESVLINNELFEDALEPIVEIPRYTSGKLAIVDPAELNQQINFFSTPGWRASDEYVRNLNMIKDMINLKGKMVLGSDWMLGSWYGRGSSKNQILQKKKVTSPIAFAQNYGGEWTGTSSNALVNINKLMDCRTLTTPEFSCGNKTDEYYMGVDVARSQNTNNNQSSVVVGKVIRNKTTNRIVSIDVVNITNIPNVLNFTTQACIVKKIANAFHVRMVIADGNGLGSGLIDELLKESFDPVTKEPLGCWDTINTDNAPETKDAEKCLYDLKAQGNQTRIITVFVEMINSCKLRLLEKRQDIDFTDEDRENLEENILPFVQTNLLFVEVGNLKLKQLPSGALTVEKVIRKIDKDRFSALAYMLWYINEFESYLNKPKESVSYSEVFTLRAPVRKTTQI